MYGLISWLGDKTTDVWTHWLVDTVSISCRGDEKMGCRLFRSGEKR